MPRGVSRSSSTKIRPRSGEPSDRVFGASNCHVLRKITVGYQFKGAGAPPQLVRVNGSRHFQHSVNEIKALIGRLGSDAELLVTKNVELRLQAMSNDPDEAAEAETGVTAKRAKLAEVKQHIGLLEEFYKDVNTHLE